MKKRSETIKPPGVGIILADGGAVSRPDRPRPSLEIPMGLDAITGPYETPPTDVVQEVAPVGNRRFNPPTESYAQQVLTDHFNQVNNSRKL